MSLALHKAYQDRNRTAVDRDMTRITKAVIFAAGLGSRLGPYTQNLPKTLLKVGDLTIFDRMIMALDKAGITNVVVITGYAGAKLQSHALSYSTTLTRNKLNFEFIENTSLDTGNIYSFWLARTKMTEDFLLLNSDVVFHHEIVNLLMRDSQAGTALAVDDSKALGAEEMKVKSLDGRVIKDITKKMDPATAHGEYIGIMKVAHKDVPLILETVDQLLSEGKFPLYYEDAFRLVAQKYDCLHACSTQNLPWTEVDTVEDMNYARDTIVPQIKEASLTSMTQR